MMDKSLATIGKIRDFDSTPKLLLEMCLANYPDAKSIVVSIENDGKTETFWTSMKNSSLAFHVYGIQADLTEALSRPE